MKLLTKSIREQLLRNGRIRAALAEEGCAEADFLPVAKLFTPDAGCTWQFENGLNARIYHDPDVENTFSYDEALRLVVLHRRYIDPSNGACGSSPDEIAAWERENAHEWFSIPLFLYDHSGTVYRVGETNPFCCPWDSGRVGIMP